jgi:hypothetical protein
MKCQCLSSGDPYLLSWMRTRYSQPASAPLCHPWDLPGLLLCWHGVMECCSMLTVLQSMGNAGGDHRAGASTSWDRQLRVSMISAGVHIHGGP